MTGNGGTCTNDLIGYRFFTTLHGVQEITNVVIAIIKLHLGVLQVLSLNSIQFLIHVHFLPSLVAGNVLIAQPQTKAATVAFHAAFGALEARAQAGSVHHVNVSLINQLRTLHRLGILGGNRGDRATAILI